MGKKKQCTILTKKVLLLILFVMVFWPDLHSIYYRPAEWNSPQLDTIPLHVRQNQQETGKKILELLREAHRLEFEGKIQEALIKYRESLSLQKDPFIQEYVKALESKFRSEKSPSSRGDQTSPHTGGAGNDVLERMRIFFDVFNLASMKVRLVFEPDNISVEGLEEANSYRIRIRNLKGTVNLGEGVEIQWDKLREMLLSSGGRPGDLSKDDIDARILSLKSPLSISEVVFRLGPEAEALCLESAKKLSVNLAILGKKSGGGVPQMNTILAIEALSLNNFDLSYFLLGAGTTGEEVAQRMIKTLADLDIGVKNLTLSSHPFAASKEEGITVSARSVHVKEFFNPELIGALLSSRGKPMSMSHVLELGPELILEIALDGLSIRDSSMTGEGGGKLDSFLFRLNVAPIEKGGYYKADLNWRMNGLAVKDAKNPGVADLINLDNFNLDLGLDHVSEGLLQMLIEKLPGINPETRRQAILEELGRTRPRVYIALDPLAHLFGSLKIRGEFSVTEEGAPEGQATVVLSSPSEVERRLRATKGMIPEKAMEQISSIIQNFFVLSAYDEGRLTLEIKGEEPGFFYLNGEKKKF